MKRLQFAVFATLLAVGVAAPSPSHATMFVYQTALDGATAGTASPGTGSAEIDWNDVANTMRVQASFSGLLGPTTAAHIHAPTASPGTGSAGIATELPSFTGFPLGVTSGTFDNTYDLTLATTYSPAYVAASGGTAAGAEAALKAALDAREAYFNIHTSSFPNGEISGFPTLVPEPGTGLLVIAGLLGFAGWRRARPQQ